MNKNGLVRMISKKTGFTQTNTQTVIDYAIAVVIASVRRGERVTLAGFGTFSLAARAARKGRNPYTGEELIIPACATPKFKAGRYFKDSVN